MAKRRNFRARLRRNRLWMRVAAAAGDRRFWGFLRIRKQHIIAEERLAKTPKRMTLRERLALMASWRRKGKDND